MTPGQRILVNTIATYGRTLLAVFLGLFSSRWVLAALGEVDYGLMGVVGSVLVFITFFNALTTAANARYFAFSIGQKDIELTRKWFNSALSISVILPSVLMVVGLFIGEYVIRYFLSIPEGRLLTSLWVFRLSLGTAYITMLCAPFIAMFTAKQNIAELSIWGMAISITTFLFVYFLSDIPGNKWLIYSIGISIITSFFSIIQALRAANKYTECRIFFPYWFKWKRIREMFSYSFWTLFGGLGGLLYHNGIAIVLNKFFPPSLYPSVNASYTIGHTVAGHTQTISSSLSGAFMPEIVSSEGRGDRDRVISLMNQSIRLSFVIISIVAFPILFQTDFILTVWLKNPPEYAALFCRTMIIAFLIMRFVGSFDSAICATGRIKFYQITMLSLASVAVIMAAILLYFDLGIKSVCAVILGYSIFFNFISLYFCKKLVGISISVWLKDVVKPILITVVAITILGIVLINLTSCLNSVGQFFIDVPSLIIFTSVINWFCLTDKSERSRIKQMIVGLKR